MRWLSSRSVIFLFGAIAWVLALIVFRGPLMRAEARLAPRLAPRLAAIAHDVATAVERHQTESLRPDDPWD